MFMRTLYWSMVGSALNYGHTCCPLTRIRKWIIKTITGSKKNAHTEPLLRALDILKIEDTLKLNALKFYYKYRRCTIPYYFYTYSIETQGAHHSHDTRQQNQPRINIATTKYADNSAKSPYLSCYMAHPLQWRHNEYDGVSNHQPHDCLLNHLFRRRSKKTSKLRVTGLYAGNSPWPANPPRKEPVTRKMFPFDEVIMSLCLPQNYNTLYLWILILGIIWICIVLTAPSQTVYHHQKASTCYITIERDMVWCD